MQLTERQARLLQLRGPLPYDTVRDYLVLPLGENARAVAQLPVPHDLIVKEPIRAERIEYDPLDGGRPFRRSVASILRRAGVDPAQRGMPTTTTG